MGCARRRRNAPNYSAKSIKGARRKPPARSTTSWTGISSKTSGWRRKPSRTNRQMADDYIRPLIGGLTLPEVQKQLVHKVERLYSELTKCKRRCGGKNGLIDHRNPRRTGRQVPVDLKSHRCNRRCRPHQCVPLSRTTIRLIHTGASHGSGEPIRVARSGAGKDDSGALGEAVGRRGWSQCRWCDICRRPGLVLCRPDSDCGATESGF